MIIMIKFIGVGRCGGVRGGVGGGWVSQGGRWGSASASGRVDLEAKALVKGQG